MRCAVVRIPEGTCAARSEEPHLVASEAFVSISTCRLDAFCSAVVSTFRKPHPLQGLRFSSLDRLRLSERRPTRAGFVQSSVERLRGESPTVGILAEPAPIPSTRTVLLIGVPAARRSGRKRPVRERSVNATDACPWRARRAAAAAAVPWACRRCAALQPAGPSLAADVPSAPARPRPRPPTSTRGASF